VILKSRDNLTALSCVRRLRVELLEVEKKDLSISSRCSMVLMGSSAASTTGATS
jgi:hypothetical protein